MNVLLVAPAYGHNIEPFLIFFNSNKKYRTQIAYQGKNELSQHYPNINFVKIGKKINLLSGFIKAIRKSDFIWIHGGYSKLTILVILLFKKSKAKVNLNFWGEVIPRKIMSNTIYAFLYRYLLKNIDFLQCNWYGTYNILKDKFNNKLVVFPWGMEESFFDESKQEVSLEAKQFVEKISKYKTRFFFPKSTSQYAKHDLVIEAIKIFNQKHDFRDYVIVFWLGNSNDESLIEKYESLIEKYALSENIILQRHSFLSFKDMKYIWSNVDYGVNFTTIDQLSTTILEPMLMKKDLIISDIEPYRIFDEKYNTKLNLVDNTVESIYQQLSQYIFKDKVKNSRILEHRKNIILQEFNFTENIEKMMEYYSAQISS